MSDTTLDIPAPDDNADTYTVLPEQTVTHAPIDWVTLGTIGLLMLYSLFSDEM